MFLPSEDVFDFFPEYRSTQIAWQGLTPVAYWLAKTIRPSRYVELGAYRGDSFFAFLQAARDVPEMRELHAVDSWSGDQHTGPFSDQVEEQFSTELARRADPRAHKLRSIFDAARTSFAPASIDLLHIDGAHDYDSVRADFESWLPLMSDNGVIAFHDTMVRADNFGVWQLWAEIEAAHPGRTFNFTHSNGLGLLCLGGAELHDLHRLCKLPAPLQQVFAEALRIAGQGIVEMTVYESRLISSGGGTCPESHVFARGEDLRALQRLRQIDLGNMLPQDGSGRSFQQEQVLTGPMAQSSNARLHAIMDKRIEDLVGKQQAELYAALAPQIAESLEARITHLVSKQKGDLYAALAPKIKAGIEATMIDLVNKQSTQIFAALASQIKAAMDARIEMLVAKQQAELYAALAPQIAESMEARITHLVSKQKGDLYAALAPKIKAGIEAMMIELVNKHQAELSAALEPSISASLGARIAGLAERVQSEVIAELKPGILSAIKAEHEQMSRMNKMKNDAQDDAIIGIGRKVDAHDTAIVSLRSHLEEVFQHPLFR